MKKLDYGSQRTVPTKLMVDKKNEDRFYKKLEQTFKEIKHWEYHQSKE